MICFCFITTASGKQRCIIVCQIVTEPLKTLLYQQHSTDALLWTTYYYDVYASVIIVLS